MPCNFQQPWHTSETTWGLHWCLEDEAMETHSRKREGPLGYRTVAEKAQWAGGTEDLSREKVCGADRGNKVGGPEELTCTSFCTLEEGIHLAFDGNRPEVLQGTVISCVWGIRPWYEDRTFAPQASPWPEWRQCCLHCTWASLSWICGRHIKGYLFG